MAKVTTVKPISLGYREVGSQGVYVPLMGVLKGLSISQDEPDSTEVEAEFYDSPFDIFYDGNPVTMTFELANYDLEELTNLFGGEIADSIDYESETYAYTSEWEWELNFGRGNSTLVIYRGLTIGTIKKDADGALNYSVTITSLVYNDGNNDHLYKIVGKITRYTGQAISSQPTFSSIVPYSEYDDDHPQPALTLIVSDESMANLSGAKIGSALISEVGSSDKNWYDIIINRTYSTCTASITIDEAYIYLHGWRSFGNNVYIYTDQTDVEFTIHAINLDYPVV